MAYFSNGTEGMMYESEYCDKCTHMHDEKGEPYACSILELHYEFNYDQGGKTKAGKAIKKVLETLIPTKENGFPGECTMFELDTKIKDDQYVKHLQDGEPPIEYLLKDAA